MTAKMIYNPHQIIIDIFNKNFPEIECDIVFVTGLYKTEQAYGCIEYDTTPMKISIDAEETSYAISIEILAHELAHAVAGKKNKHGKKWEMVFNKINQLYNSGSWMKC